jgi:hypothetical protein
LPVLKRTVQNFDPFLPAVDHCADNNRKFNDAQLTAIFGPLSGKLANMTNTWFCLQLLLDLLFFTRVVVHLPDLVT